MLSVTFEARCFIADMPAYDGSVPLRLVVPDRNAFRLEPDEIASSDLTFSHEGRTLLVVDADLALSLDGKELAAVETAEGARLALRERPPTLPDDLL